MEEPFVAIVPGGLAIKLGKLLGEITDGVEANNSGYLLNLQTGVFQVTGSLLAAFLIQKGNKRNAHFLFKLMR